MRKPNLQQITELLARGKDFELTNQQYKKKTEADFPKDKNYAEKRSAVAREAAKYDYRIEVIPQRILFIKNT